tara:strand:+ start:3992 stop:4594 length:603 start_codon:yes stop_codon:yes gene_type:complete
MTPVQILKAYGEGVQCGEYTPKKETEQLTSLELLKFAMLMQGSRTESVFEYLQGKRELNKLRYWKTQKERLEHLEDLKGIDKALNGRSASKLRLWLKSIKGIGEKKAQMLINVMHRDLGHKFRDPENIDVATDVHVMRVFKRLGFSDGTPKDTIMAARRLNPEYPGELDLSAWYLGMKVCREFKPKCNVCILKEECPSRF